MVEFGVQHRCAGRRPAQAGHGNAALYLRRPLLVTGKPTMGTSARPSHENSACGGCALAHHPLRHSHRRPDMFQVVVNSWEIVKAYSELVDPVQQRRRLEEQATMRQAGDDEA